MSATFNEISTKLSSKNPIVIIRKNINISNYYYIEDNFDNLNSYSLYICKLSNFPKDFKSDKIINFLIIVDVNIKYDLFQLKNCNILILEKDKISLYKLLEDLQDIINVNADIIASSNSIIDALSQNQNIDDIIKTIHHYLQNPIIITNSANYLCCHSDDNFDINDTIWEDYLKYGYPDPNYLEKIYYNIKFVQPLSTESDSHIIDYLDVMEHRVLTCPIKINNFNIAYIYVLEANKPFNKEDMRVLNILGKILAPSIINDPRFSYCENTQIDSIFYYLLSCNNTQPHFLENTCEILNLELHSNFFLLNINYSKEEMKIISRWKYAKLGVTKQSVTLFSSSCDINNYTIFPSDFEEQYFYTYILAIYTKLYLKKINLKFRQGININKTRKEFIRFTKKLWINEVTDDDTGSIFYQHLKDILELDNIYFDTKNKFDILYKEMNIEKNTNNNILVVMLLFASFIINIINIIYLLKK